MVLYLPDPNPNPNFDGLNNDDSMVIGERLNNLGENGKSLLFRKGVSIRYRVLNFFFGKWVFIRFNGKFSEK